MLQFFKNENINLHTLLGESLMRDLEEEGPLSNQHITILNTFSQPSQSLRFILKMRKLTSRNSHINARLVMLIRDKEGSPSETSSGTDSFFQQVQAAIETEENKEPGFMPEESSSQDHSSVAQSSVASVLKLSGLKSIENTLDERKMPKTLRLMINLVVLVFMLMLTVSTVNLRLHQVEINHGKGVAADI